MTQRDCTFSKFTDDTQLSAAIDTTKGYDVIQTDMEELEKWVNEPHEVHQGQVQSPVPGLKQSAVAVAAGDERIGKSPAEMDLRGTGR